jgi:hypothetical protein
MKPKKHRSPSEFVKKKNPRSPVGVGIFGIFGILSSSNPPSGIFGFYPGKGPAYSP